MDTEKKENLKTFNQVKEQILNSRNKHLTTKEVSGTSKLGYSEIFTANLKKHDDKGLHEIIFKIEYDLGKISGTIFGNNLIEDETGGNIKSMLKNFKSGLFQFFSE